MSAVFFHRTTIADARRILKEGHADTEWDFGLRDAKTGESLVLEGVWLANRPLAEAEGPAGDALLQIEVQLSDDELKPFELVDMLWDARLWVVPAEVLNLQAQTKLIRVDPRTSWGFHAITDDEVPEDPT